MKNRLKIAEGHFSDWHRLGKRKGRASKHLMREAVSLLSDYTMSEVSEVLRVPLSTLKKWKIAQANRASKELNLIPVSLQKSEWKEEEGKDDFRLLLPNGVQVCLGKVSRETTIQLIQELLKGGVSCSI